MPDPSREVNREPNPKDFPFNYVIEWADGEREDFDDFRAAESSIDAWCDTYYLTDVWSNRDDSPFTLLGLGGDVFQVIWKSLEDAKQLDRDLTRILDEEFGDPMNELERRKSLGHGVLLRERRAFEQASQDHWEERSEHEPKDYGTLSDSEDEPDFCGLCGEDCPDGCCPTHGPLQSH